MGLLILLHPFHLPPYLSHSVSSSLTFHFSSVRLSFEAKRKEKSSSFLFKQIEPREENDTWRESRTTKQMAQMLACRVCASLDEKHRRNLKNYGRVTAATCSTPHICPCTCVSFHLSSVSHLFKQYRGGHCSADFYRTPIKVLCATPLSDYSSWS